MIEFPKILKTTLFCHEDEDKIVVPFSFVIFLISLKLSNILSEK